MLEEPEREGRWVRGLSVGLGILATTGAGLMGWALLHTEKALPPMREHAAAVQVPDLAMARTVLDRYFEAPTDESRIAFLHDPDRVRPLWLDYYRSRGKPFPLMENADAGKLALFGSRTVAVFQVKLQPGGVRPMALVWDGGGFGIDWESSAAYGTMDWAEWLETKPTVPQLMRVYVSRTRASSGQGMEVMVIQHAEGLNPVKALIPTGVGLPLDFSGRQRIPVTAEFRFINGEIEMTRFLYEGWSR